MVKNAGRLFFIFAHQNLVSRHVRCTTYTTKKKKNPLSLGKFAESEQQYGRREWRLY